MAVGSWIYERTSPIGDGGVPAPPAPNILAAVPTFTTSQIGGKPVLFPWAIVTLPTAHANYSHLKRLEIKVHAADTTFTGLAVEIAVDAPFSPDGSGNITVTLPSILQDTVAHTYDWTFQVRNEDGVISAGALQVANVAAPAAGGPDVPPPNVASVTGGEVAASRYPEIGTRLTRAKFDATVTLTANQGVQTWLLWLSKDNGANWQGIDWFPANGLTGTGRIDQAIPETTQTWKFAAMQGRVPFNAGILIPDGSLPAGAVRQTTGFSVAGLGLPGGSQDLGAAALPGVGGTFPYAAQTNDGSQYWRIPGFTIRLDTANADPNAGTINVTMTDLDASGNQIGPEHPYGTVRIVPTAGTPTGNVNIGDLVGEYGPFGDTYTRKYPWPSGTAANIAAVRVKFYGSSRLDQTTGSWSNPASSVLLTDTASGLNHLTVTVAVGGAIPPGKILASRIDPASLDPSLVQRVSGLAMNTTDLSNMQLNPSFADDLRAWTGLPPGMIAIATGGASLTGGKSLSVQTPDAATTTHVYGEKSTCRPGDVFYTEAWVATSTASTDGGINIGAEFLDASLNPVATYTYVNRMGPIVGYNKMVAPLATAPAGTSFVRFIIGLGYGHNPATGWYLVDNVVLRPQVSTGQGTAPDGSGGVELNSDNLTNMVLNGSFEHGDLEGWTHLYGTGAVELAAGASFQPSGKYRFRSVAAASGYDWINESVSHTCRPGDVFYAESYFWMGTDATGAGVMAMFFVDAAGAAVPAPGQYTVISTHTNTWVKMTLTTTAPASAAFVNLALYVEGAVPGAVGTYIDGAFMTRQIPTGAGTQPDGSGGVMVKVAGPVFTEVSGALNLKFNTSDFIDSAGVLTQKTVNLAIAVGFAGAEFETSAGYFGVKAIGVAKLLAGTALFTGTATFAYTSTGAYVQIGAAGAIFGENISTPGSGSTVTINSTGVTIQKGSSKVEVTAAGVLLTNASISIATAQGTVSINSTTNGVSVDSGGNFGRLWAGHLAVFATSGSYLSEVNPTYLRIASVACVNSSGQWTGGYSGGSTSTGSISVYSLAVGSGGFSCSGSVNLSGTFNGTHTGTHSGTWSGSISPGFYGGGSTGSGSVSVYACYVGGGGLSINGWTGVSQYLTIRDYLGNLCTIQVGTGGISATRMDFHYGLYTGQI